jgi:myo-inositol-1(or 4)-monophosphatase
VDALSADWTAICRRVVAGQRAIFEEVRTSAERTVYEGVGEGGDRTLEIDRRCEDVVFAELTALEGEGGSFVAVSEERGEVEFGGGGEVRVVIDPIDGSLNARRTIPSHSVSVAVASGGSMADVEFGYVYDFGAEEEFVARRGQGALVGAVAAQVAAGNGRLEVVGIESMEPQWSQGALAALVDKAYRLRVVGSIAITAVYVGSGRFDAMLSLRDCRSVDAAAAQLFAREAGGFVAFGELDLADASLDLGARYPIAAGRDEESLATVLAAQRV